MAKTQLTKQQKLEKKLKEIANLRKSIKEDKKKIPLDFSTKLEKLFGFEFTQKNYNDLYEFIKNNKSSFDKTLPKPSASATTSTSTNTTTQKTTTTNTTYGTNNQVKR